MELDLVFVLVTWDVVTVRFIPSILREKKRPWIYHL